MDHSALKTLFPGVRLTRIVNTTKLCPLRYAEVVTYSCLVQRATHGKGARKQQVSNATGLHESSTVPKALLALQRHGLAEQRGVYWWAVEPTPDRLSWFRYCKGSEGQNWHRRFAYWWTAIRRRKARLTATQTSLYFKLMNLRDYGRPITVRGLARLLRVDVKTVIQGLKKLRAVNLVDGMMPNDPAPEQVKWFRPRREKPPFRASEFFSCFIDPEHDQAVLTKPLVDGGGKLLLDAGFSERQAHNYIDSVLKRGRKWPVVYAFFSRFDEFFRTVQGQHQKNVKAGKYKKARNCRGLLEVETRKRLSALAGERNWG
jgi:hypothetical protein